MMSNHLHMVLQQGHLPLSATMQPLLCRIALRVRRKYNIAGHVFGASYWDEPITDSARLQTLIRYIHFNPVRSQLCASEAEWEWSSHAAYHNRAAIVRLVEPFNVAEMLNITPVQWAEEPLWRRRPTVDLRSLLAFQLRKITSGEIDLDTALVMRGRRATQLRCELIAVAAEAGYRGAHIARVTGVSEATVSRIATALRLKRSRAIAE